MAITPLEPKQINFRELFSVENILKSRGFEVKSLQNLDNLLITDFNNIQLLNLLYKIFYQTNTRNILKNFLYNKILKENISNQNILQLINNPCFLYEKSRFDNSLEWFIGELMINDFAAFSYSYGVEINNILNNSSKNSSGDFDTLVILRDTNIAYFECKAGSYSNIEIMKCYERMLSLHCQFSIFICIEKISEEKLIFESKKIKLFTTHHTLEKYKIKEAQEIVYEILNCYFIDMTGDFINKIKTVLRINNAKKNANGFAFRIGNNFIERHGYECQQIDKVDYN